MLGAKGKEDNMNSAHSNGNGKTIIIGGFGPGISTAVAEQFGSNGFSLALIGRNAERVAAGAKELTAKGFRAEPFVADLSKPEEIRDVVSNVRCIGLDFGAAMDGF
jgi:short-subunit dehydrogenase